MRKILDVIKENEAIACKTFEEAKEYCDLAYEQGLKWSYGWETYKYKRNWHLYESNTVYLPHRGQYGYDKKQKEGVVIISFEEFKSRLTENKIVMRKILDVVKKGEGVYCRTLDEVIEYCLIAHKQGLEWDSGEPYYRYGQKYFMREAVYFPHEGVFGSHKNYKSKAISFEELKERLNEDSEIKEENKMNKTEAKQTSNVDYDARRYELVKMIIEYVTINSTSDAILGEVFAKKVFETADYIVEQLKRKENE